MDKNTCKIVSDTIQNMGADDFQKFCTQLLPLLNDKYKGLERHGATKTGKTRKGTPDSILTTNNGTQIAMQASVEENYWGSSKDNITNLKPYKDVVKCIKNLSSVSEVILMSNQELPTNNADVKSSVIKKIQETNADLIIKIFSLVTFESLFQADFKKYYPILKDYMNIEDINYVDKNLNNNILVKQYICKDFNIVKEILSAEFENFPDDNNPPIIFNDKFTDLMKKFINKHFEAQKFRKNEINYDINTIKQKYSNLILAPEKKEQEFITGSIACRPFELADLNGYYIQKQIVENGYNINDLGNYEYYLELCGGGLQTRYNIIEPFFSFLYIKNTTQRVIILESINAKIFNDIFKVRENCFSDETKNYPLRKIQIEPNQSVIIPQGLLLWDSEELLPDYYENIFARTELAHYQEYGIEEFLSNNESKNKVITPYRYIKELKYKVENNEYIVEVEPFDSNLYYSINKCWYCGSCPHIYLHKKNDEWVYYGETLSSKNDINYSYILPIGYDKVRLVELEKEISVIKYLKINNQEKIFCEDKNLSLKQDEYFEICIEPNTPVYISIYGHYECKNDIMPNDEVLKYKQKIIDKYKKFLNNKLSII